MTTHFRKADPDLGRMGLEIPIHMESVQEKRIGLDGKWDIGPGVWFEGALVHQNLPIKAYQYRRLTTVGMDYTFDVGNGIYVMAEYLTVSISNQMFKSGMDSNLSACMIRYPVGLLDQWSFMQYYDWEKSESYWMINWNRSWDNWQIYFLGFWNPDTTQLPQMQSENNFFLGKGLQVIVVFNH